MNARRRKELESISSDLSELRDYIDSRLSDIRDRLEAVKDEEQECADNTPENLQMTGRYENSCNAVECMENALSSLDDTVNEIESATD